MTPPQGHVTYLFTDMENSSGINAAVGNDIYGRELRDPHFDRLRECIAAHNGLEVGTPAGDSLMVVFDKPDDALACAKAMQESLHAKPIQWTQDGVMYTVRVRIGLHTAQHQVFPPDYSGSDANFAKRVESLGKGEQIIVHQSVRKDATTWQRYEWQAWAGRRLKSFDTPETVYEMLWDGGKSRGEPGERFLPDWYAGERNVYIPRTELEDEIMGGFGGSHVNGQPYRLITLHGFGGMGKTRLGLACLLKMVGLFHAQVHAVQLEFSQPDRNAVSEAIGKALGLSGEAALLQNLIATLQNENFDRLLLLDNYETVHCDDVAKFLRDLLNATRHVRLLVTGREATRIYPLEKIIPIHGLTAIQAEQLFVARVGLRLSNWQIDEGDERRAFEQILVDMERMPLALELVAASVGKMGRETLRKVADALHEMPLPAAPRGVVNADPAERHQSLTKCLDWSCKYLSPEAVDCLERLGLFADTFTPETVAQACGLPDPSIALEDLHDASLLVSHTPAESRYILLRPTRAYAADRVNARPDTNELLLGYVKCYDDLAEENGGVTGDLSVNDASKRAVMSAEWRNMMAAVEYAERLQEWFITQNIAARLTNFLDLRALWAESVQIGLRALTAAQTEHSKGNEGVALGNLGIVYQRQGRWDEALDCYKQSLVVFRELGDRKKEGNVLNNLGVAYRNQGHWDEAIDFYEQDLAICRELGDQHGEGQTLNNLGIVHHLQGRWDEAIDCYEKSLVIRRALKDQRGEGMTLNNLGNTYKNQSLWNEALKCFEQSLAICRELGNQHGEGQTLYNVALLHAERGDYALALQWEREALRVLETTQDERAKQKTRNWIAEWERLVATE